MLAQRVGVPSSPYDPIGLLQQAARSWAGWDRMALGLPTRDGGAQRNQECRMQDIVNSHIHRELASAYHYQILSALADIEDFPGFAHWFAVQAQEEQTHADKLIEFQKSRRSYIEFAALAAETPAGRHPDELMDSALAYEVGLQKFIHQQARQAETEGLEPYRELLDWFIAEQVEEVEQCLRIRADIRRIGTDFTGLMILDRELGQRAV